MMSSNKRKQGEGTGKDLSDPIQQATTLLKSTSTESTEKQLETTRRILETVIISQEKLLRLNRTVSQYISMLEEVC